MATSNPTRPDEKQELDPETERILRERDATFDEQYPKREDAENAMKDIRQHLNNLAPR
jgi:hypothetical protein